MSDCCCLATPGDEHQRTAPSGAVFMYRMYSMPREARDGRSGDVRDVRYAARGQGWPERRCTGCTDRKLLLRFRHSRHPWRSADNCSLRDLHSRHPWRSADNCSLRDLHSRHPWRSYPGGADVGCVEGRNAPPWPAWCDSPCSLHPTRSLPGSGRALAYRMGFSRQIC